MENNLLNGEIWGEGISHYYWSQDISNKTKITARMYTARQSKALNSTTSNDIIFRDISSCFYCQPAEINIAEKGSHNEYRNYAIHLLHFNRSTYRFNEKQNEDNYIMNTVQINWIGISMLPDQVYMIYYSDITWYGW